MLCTRVPYSDIVIYQVQTYTESLSFASERCWENLYPAEIYLYVVSGMVHR